MIQVLKCQSKILCYKALHIRYWFLNWCHWSLLLWDFIELPPFLTFWPRPSKMVNFNAQKSENEAQKKDILRIHIGMDFLQKTGSKLVNFCLSGPIYIFPPPIGGRHPVPCLGTQISERDMVQQCASGNRNGYQCSNCFSVIGLSRFRSSVSPCLQSQDSPLGRSHST